MRIKTIIDGLSSSDTISLKARTKVTNITLVNQSDATVLVGMNTDNPVIQLAVGQSIGFDAGENSIWGDGEIKINYQTATQKQIVFIQTIDLGEI